MNTIKILRSPNAVLVVLVLALIAQTPHASDVFRIIGHGSNVLAYAHSYSFAIALELAVLVFVVQNKHIESYSFAAVSVAMNLSYYFLTNTSLFTWPALPAWLVSVALPAAIARYSHVVVDIQPDTEHQPAKRMTRTVRVIRTDEQSEQYAIVQPAQIEAQSEQLTIDLTTMSDEQKRQHVAAVLRTNAKPNKTKLARELGIGRTTLYAWLMELAEVQT